MKFLIGKKQNMTQIYDEEGNAHPTTVVSVLPMTVTQIKTVESDGYQAIQVGIGDRKEKNINKAQKKKGNFSELREFKVEDPSQYKVGDKIEIKDFAEGDLTNVTAISKGKGFQGVVKRHGFHGGPRTHGQKHSEREGGSIGGGGRAGGRVVKGMKMPGRMGGEKTTVKNLKIVKIDLESNEIYLEGAVPGRRGTLVEVKAK